MKKIRVDVLDETLERKEEGRRIEMKLTKCLSDKNFNEVFILAKKGSDLGNGFCINKLANFYWSGKYIEKDRKKGFELFLASSEGEQKRTDSIFNLAKIYTRGEVVDRDFKRGVQYLFTLFNRRKSFPINKIKYYLCKLLVYYPEELYDTGFFEYSEEGVTSFVLKMISFLKEQVELCKKNRRKTVLLRMLAKGFEEGFSILHLFKDKRKALLLYEDAVKHGCVRSLLSLGKIYTYGERDVISVDLTRAEDCYILGGRQGRGKFLRKLAELYFNNKLKPLQEVYSLLEEALSLGDKKSIFSLGSVHDTLFRDEMNNEYELFLSMGTKPEKWDGHKSFLVEKQRRDVFSDLNMAISSYRKMVSELKLIEREKEQSPDRKLLDGNYLRFDVFNKITLLYAFIGDMKEAFSFMVEYFESNKWTRNHTSGGLTNTLKKVLKKGCVPWKPNYHYLWPFENDNIRRIVTSIITSFLLSRKTKVGPFFWLLPKGVLLLIIEKICHLAIYPN